MTINHELMTQNVKIHLTLIILSTWMKMTKSSKLLMKPQEHLNQILKLLRMKMMKVQKNQKFLIPKPRSRKKDLDQQDQW